MFALNGIGPAGRGQNQGQVFVRLKDWSQRTAVNQSVQALLGRVNQHYAAYKDEIDEWIEQSRSIAERERELWRRREEALAG